MQVLLVDYPGHVIATVMLLAAAAVLVVAYRSMKLQPARGWRWLLGILQLAVVAALLVIIWNPAQPRETESEASNTVLVFFDSSESMSVADSADSTRLDRAIEVFDQRFREGSGRLPNFRIYGFDSTCYHCQDATHLRRWGSRTDMQRMLKIIGRYDSASDAHLSQTKDTGAVVGAVVFTDGQADEKNHELYFPLRNKELPVLLVGVGSQRPTFDVAVKSIKAPTTVALDTVYQMQAVITTKGLRPDDSVTVELLRDSYPMEIREFTAEELAIDPQVRFSLDGDELGWQRIGVRVSMGRDEVNPANNVRQTMVRVARNDDLKVLLYSRVANFDIGKIRSALERDRKIQLDIGLDAIISPGLSETVRSMAGHVELPGDREGFNRYDIIILGPVAFDDLGKDQIEALYSFVADRGGGLILLPGKDDDYSLERVKNKRIRALLPVDFEGEAEPDAGQRPAQLTLEGEASGVLQPEDLENDPARLGLPHTSLRKKPASTTIMQAYDRPILCTQRLGRGRVAVLNASGLFQWYRENEDGGLLRTLLSGLTSYVGRTTSLEAGLELFPQRDLKDQSTVTFDAYVYDENFKPVAGATVLLEFGGEVQRMYPMSAGHYVAQVANVMDEAIVARAEAQMQGVFLGERTCAVTLPIPRGEMDELALDSAFLKRLAKKIGARYLRENEIDTETVELFPPTRPVVNVSKLESIWPRWGLLLSLCGLLSVAWFIRRARGLI